MSAPPPASVFAQTLFPLLLGSALACPLYGVALAQGISYFRNYLRDPTFVKYSIALLLVIDGAHTFSLANAILVWYLRAAPSTQYPPGLPISLFFSYVTTGFVQSAFTLRVWILSSKNWLVTSILGFFVLSQLVGGLGMAASQQINGEVSSVLDINSKAFGSLELVSAMICDIMISSSLVYFLHKNRSGIKTTESLIDKLIIYFIGIGTLSSVFALLNMVTWWAMPDKLIFTTFHSIISKLYVNSLLVTLNSRNQLRHNLGKVRGIDYTHTDDSIALSTFAAGVN
ncbi:hypothetical protein EYR40_007420 [Pleurotus pulmonarius]|nr:hypothetical protein EYR36_008259 [Pleurotus pulmonarius]KAF4579979.1 hypothetical protein EYR36_001799 [Pleurotus pulmonarius]KAF4596970.1 hypothetical protein EYR40_007420 [Pleurotus pulmonarius]